MNRLMNKVNNKNGSRHGNTPTLVDSQLGMTQVKRWLTITLIASGSGDVDVQARASRMLAGLYVSGYADKTARERVLFC